MFLVAGLISGCSLMSGPDCPAGLKHMTDAELFFGRAIAGGGSVSDAEWRSFLDTEVTPRFPGGLTVQDASGQWKGEQGYVRENSKRMTIVLAGVPGEQARLDAIRNAYKRRFGQEAVLILEHQACGAF